ncbi:ABC transporter G family member 10 [Salvia divinorum]|uniref:ABC transporter G family member 10 n=1 Tax=Salvia divinorum TaxID=28513 RepID=A0ABD1G3J0_SALDI
MELPVTSPASYTIQTNSLSFMLTSRRSSATKKLIIENVSLEARPGEITAIAGPSGAGKTTLLQILAGEIPSGKLSGEILINGCPAEPERFGRVSGYVTQDDALFPLLTVEETLTYSALLRLAPEQRDARRRAKLMMKDLGLEHISASRVESISGGERRRLSIGVELIHDPVALLIDEPTSGLDSASALHIVSLLRSMAVTKQKTIVLTIHQPGFRILELIDRLLLLSGGRVLHNGNLESLEERLVSSGHCIPSHINVLEFAIEVASSSRNIDPRIDVSVGRDLDSREYSKNRKKDSVNGQIATSLYANSWIDEVAILGERFARNVFRTKELFTARALQALAVGSILGTVYMNVHNGGDREKSEAVMQTRLGFFAFTLSFLLSSTTEGLPIFLQERRIFAREAARGAYRVSSYALANALVLLPFLAAVALLYSAPAYWLVGLRRDPGGFLYFALVAWAVVAMSSSLTACCAALMPDFIMGASLIAGVMGAFFLFSGYFIAEERIPEYWVFMHYLSMFKYPFECLVINEYGGRGCVERVVGECVISGDEYLRKQGLKESHRWSNLGVMFGFVVGYRLLCFLILWCRSLKTRRL